MSNDTERKIRNLCREAGEAGDLVRAHICRVALGEESAIFDGAQFEERYGGGGFDTHEKNAIMAVENEEQAIVICLAAISG